MAELTSHNTSSRKATSATKDASQSWITDDLANVICEAFRDGENKGKKKFLDEQITYYRKEYQAGLDVFKNYYDRLWADGINCYTIHVRIASLNILEAIFIIPEKDYFNTNFAKAVQVSRGYVHPNPTITLNYRFMPFHNKINYAALESDGFSTTFGVK